MSYRMYSTAVGRIVDAAGKGDFTTIAAATTAASSGDTIFIRPGTYTEDITPKNGVTYVAFNTTAENAGVKIIGKLSVSTATSVSFKNIYFQTNADNIFSITGTSNVTLNFNNCYFNATNATAFSCTASNGAQQVNFKECNGNLGTTGITWWVFTRGAVSIRSCNFSNTAVSTTTSTFSNGSDISVTDSVIQIPITTSNTASCGMLNAVMRLGGGYNLTCLTLNGTGAISIEFCLFESGTSSCISIGAGAAAEIYNTTVESTNTNAITGAGTLMYGALTFPGTSSTMNTTTQTAQPSQVGITRSDKQPAFLAYLNTSVTDVTGDGTQYTVIYDTEVYDQSSNFNLATSTFTAPFTGRYNISVGASLIGGTVMTAIICRITTSNRVYRVTLPNNAGVTSTASAVATVLTDMDAADTFTITLQATDTGGKIDDAAGTTGGEIRNWVSGYLAF